jgi:6-phosphogluconolactonase
METVVKASEGRIEQRDDPQQLAVACADWIVSKISERNDKFRIALSGGSTPRELYAVLASERFFGVVDWDRVEFFWGDERFVPATSPDNNYRMAHDVLLSKISVAAQNIHPIPTDGTPDDAAKRYEKELKSVYDFETLNNDQPLFDLVLLGLGDDGHTASLLPGSPVLGEKSRWVAAVTQGRPEARVTLTYPAIASGRTVAFLVTGVDKAKTVAAVRSGDQSLPAARIQSQGEIVWFLDKAAAGG